MFLGFEERQTRLYRYPSDSKKAKTRIIRSPDVICPIWYSSLMLVWNGIPKADRNFLFSGVRIVGWAPVENKRACCWFTTYLLARVRIVFLIITFSTPTPFPAPMLTRVAEAALSLAGGEYYKRKPCFTDNSLGSEVCTVREGWAAFAVY
jgi:hypothetical protein